MVSLKKPIWTVSSSVLTRTDDHSMSSASYSYSLFLWRLLSILTYFKENFKPFSQNIYDYLYMLK